MIRTMVLLFCWGFMWTGFAGDADWRRGIGVFRDYCSGCHALKYVHDAPIVRTSLPNDDARHWFGRVPPDLSLVVRTRGAAWVRDYLLGFYEDPSKPFGVDNRLLPGTAMPHVFSAVRDEATRVKLVHDVVSFLEHAADPLRALRYRCGVGVIIFLSLVFGLMLYCA